MANIVSKATRTQAIRETLAGLEDQTSLSGKEVATLVNQTFGFRGKNKVTEGSIAAVRAHITRESSQPEGGSDPAVATISAANQRKIARSFAQTLTPDEVAKSMRLWKALIKQHGSVDAALEILSNQATLISSLGDSPNKAQELIESVRR
jgi:hypothetical protein